MTDGAGRPAQGLTPSLLARLAVRNVRRSARRSLLTASAMVIGLALLIFARTIGDGSHESWIDQGVRLSSGHVVVQGEGFQRDQSLSAMLPADALARATETLTDPNVAPRLETWAVRLTVQGLASSPTSSVPVVLTGVAPEEEADFSLLDDNLVDGRYLTSEDRLAAYVGSGLVERLGLRLGSRFVVTAADASGEIQGQLLRITGIFRTGVPEIDDGVIHLPLSTSQSWLGTAGAVTSMAVILGSSRDTRRVADSFRQALDGLPVEVLGWRQSNPELDAGIKIDDLGGWVFNLIILLIVALAILNAVLMSVLNRSREFGVMRALGLTGPETSRVVLVEGVLLTLVSGMAGMLLGMGVVWFFWRDGLDMSFMMEEDLTFAGTLFDPVMYPQFRWMQVGQSLFFTLAIGILASLYPARQAAKIDVAEAMKFER